MTAGNRSDCTLHTLKTISYQNAQTYTQTRS